MKKLHTNQNLFKLGCLFFVVLTIALLKNNNKFLLAEGKQENRKNPITICPSNGDPCYTIAQNQPTYCGPVYCCPPSEACYKKVRGKKNIAIFSPINGEFLLDTKPTFAWQDNAKNQTYKVTLTVVGEKIPLWEIETNENTITYPQNRNELKYNSYLLTVENNFISTEINFNVISQEGIEEIKKEIEEIKNQSANPTFNIAKWYRQNRLITEARKTLEAAIANNVKTPQIYFELAEINREIGNWEEVIKKLKEAHKLSMSQNQPFWAAQAEQFMAEIYYCGKNDKINSIDWYEKAKETYQQLGNTEYVKGIESIIKQLKDSDSNPDICNN